MTKRRRKLKKTRSRVVGDMSETMTCQRGDSESKSDEMTASCGSPSIEKQTKKMKEEDVEQKHQPQHALGLKRRRGHVTLMSGKIFSVSFFIPLDSRHDDREVPAETLIDWSNLLLYRCNRPGMLPHLPDEQARKMFYYKPTVLPELKLKYRTLSGSSTSNKNGFTNFQNDDKRDDDYDNDCDHVKSNRCTVGGSNIVSESENSQSKRRVTFVDNSQLTTVHWIVAWDYAYRAARVSHWMTMARNRKRFQHRIQSLEPILSPILNPEHRERIRETRRVIKSDSDSD